MNALEVISVSAAVVALTVSVALIVDTTFVAYRSRWRSGGRPGRGVSVSPLTAVASTVSSAVLVTFAVLALQRRPSSMPEWILAASLIVAAVGTGLPVLAAVPRLVRSLVSGRRSSERRSTRGVWTLVLVVVILLVTLGLVAVGVRLGPGQLGGAESTRSIPGLLSELLVLTSGSGALAFAAVEFVKRQSPLRRLYNRRAVERYFRPPMENIRAELLSHWRELPDNGRARTPVTPIAPISYAADIQQLTAQVGHAARTLLQASVSATLPAIVMSSIFQSVLGDRHIQYFVQDLPDDRHQEVLDEALESRLDAFQVEVTSGWHSLLRSVSGVAAALFACMLAWVLSANGLAIVLAGGLGLVIGGPVSWVIRDLVRVIERKAAY